MHTDTIGGDATPVSTFHDLSNTEYAGGDMRCYETLLDEQVQTLHRIFRNATTRCEEQPTPETQKLFGAIALKAQNYCRQTVALLAKIKNALHVRKLNMNVEKARNEILNDPIIRWQKSLKESERVQKSIDETERRRKRDASFNAWIGHLKLQCAEG